MKENQTKIINYIQNELLDGEISELTAEVDLLGTDLVDSLGMMKLITFLEKEFQVSVPPEDMIIENFFSVESIDSYITLRKKAN